VTTREPAPHPSAPPAGLPHLPALDGLRGLAVIAVLLFHAGYLPGGYLGVDAFFVLSGFLITSLLLAEVGRAGRVDLGAFWGRRARRLLPALFLTIATVAGYAALAAPREQLLRLRGDALAALVYASNWRAIGSDEGYWDLFAAPSPLAHMWSLAIEEQFYLLWPLVIGAVALGVRRRAGRRATARAGVARLVLVVSLLLAAASTVTMVLLYRAGDVDRAYMGSDTRASAVLLGAALAAWRMSRPAAQSGWTTPRRALEIAAGAAVVLLGWAWWRVDGQAPWLYRGGFLVCGLAVATTIAASAHPQRGPVGRGLSWRPLTVVGLVSYGLYLWHWPVYVVLTPQRTGWEGLGLLVARLLVSAVLATVSFVVVERPVRTGRLVRWRVARVPVAAPAAAALCVVAVLGATLGASTAGEADAGRQFEVLVAPDADAAAGVAARPEAPQEAEPRRVLIVGDSVAGSVADGAVGAAGAQRLSLALAGVNACLLTEDVTDVETSTAEANLATEPGAPCLHAWTEAIERFRPDRVVVIYGSGAAFQRYQLHGTWGDACDTGYRTWYLRTLGDWAREVTAEGTALDVVTLPYPTYGALPADNRERLDCANDLNQQVAQRFHQRVIDLGDHICPEGECRLEASAGGLLRPDGIHFGSPASDYKTFSGPGSEEVGAWLIRAVVDPPGRPIRVLD